MAKQKDITNQIRGFLYKLVRLLGDYNAVKKGKSAEGLSGGPLGK